MNILFNSEGTPMMLECAHFFGDTAYNAMDDVRKRDILAPFDVSKLNTQHIPGTNKFVMNWGKDNLFPLKAADKIASTSVLNTGLKFLRSLTIGQGLYACEVTGVDAKGNEVLAPIEDKAIQDYLDSPMIRKYMELVSRDYFKFGNSAVQMIPSVKGDTIAALAPINAMYFRYTLPDAYGQCETCVSPYWGQPHMLPQEEVRFLYTLPNVSPDAFAHALKAQGKMKQSFVYPVRDSWSNNDWYSEPIWLPAYRLGWVDIAHMVPTFLKKAYQNQITWKWHVQIPYSYWDKKYPLSKYSDSNARKMDIQRDMDKIENNLCGIDNAEKPLFTNYAINEMGRIEEEWKITALDNKYKGGDNLVTSAAANSEILFALMVNPNVLGAGMPGGAYAGNQGGSNIREAFLVNIANAWIDRQCFLDPIALSLDLNGMTAGAKVKIRFRNTVLTTLDTGAGTQKTLS